MANPTTNFGWVMPTSTDLVTDLPADFAVFGQGVDTTMADLKGGTTGQVLSKTSNTDMDFTWTAAGVSATIVDAKGDLIAATAADTVSRLAVGSNDQVLTADSSTATGLKWATPSSGGMTQLASGTLSNTASVSLTSISGNYVDLILLIRDLRPATDNSNFKTRINNITSTSYSTFVSSSSGYGYDDSQINTVSFMSNSDADNMIRIEFYDYANTTEKKLINIKYNIGSQSDPTTLRDVTLVRGSKINTSSAIDRIDFFMDSGNMTSGTYILYGVK